MRTSVTALAASRQAILNSFDDTDSEAVDLERMEKLAVIETQIGNATFETDAEKAAGNKILMEAMPNRWDDFQEALFLRMQEF